ncbi:PLC-like phosphodiesterase [Sodiomyces alkalinus F11]|uniref:PLC-like phosphodiesterase n=1 Tax=Sodiomyces alkalinus (strain CBS 110278 / VKM F-3762 / F11) TaxID=1314773 RepID=A0A3N2Q1U7_SODAK|nr:PLC-like phosphodiesterase [Sodiomyces alkalinus F11]ROT40743.1 PLC-like phosphodiesterase [Sodiomyces alkalinus F11]
MAVRTGISKRSYYFPVFSLFTTVVLIFVLFSSLLSLDPCLFPGKSHCYRGYHSEYSFDIDRVDVDHSSWMQSLPDETNLTSLSIPGTHDTLTFDIWDETYQCQNHNLAAQLRAGMRYLDVRGRLTNNSILIYHADRYTGYTLADVLLAVFGFLDEHPSETIVMRLKEEGRPYGQNDRTFEEAFAYYLHNATATASGAQDHFYMPESFFPLPTLGALRGKILLLQNFPTATSSSSSSVEQGKPRNSTSGPEPRPGSGRYGLVWDSDAMVLEDLWIIPSLQHLDLKWDAVEAALVRAANGSTPAGKADDALYLSHLSASVGVLPIEAAAGSRDGSVVGMNGRTGRWLVEQAPSHRGRTGIVIMDFPGQDLVGAVLERNAVLADGAWSKRGL